jgi:hypothetical protein
VEKELLHRAEPMSSLAGGNVIHAIQEFDFTARACMFIEEECVVPGYLRESISGHPGHVGGFSKVDAVVLVVLNPKPISQDGMEK